MEKRVLSLFSTFFLKKQDINTVNKYDGYKFVGTNPTTIPNTINNNGIIKVYYEKDTFGYTVEYYYDGVIDNSKTESKTALFEETISTYTDKKITGYKLEKTENLPLVITSDTTKNVIKVYYVKDNYGYKVEYYYDGVLDDSKTYTSSAEFGSKVETYPDKVIKGYSFEKTENFPLTITENTESNLIKVYYVSNSYDYTIKHVEKGNETNILETESNSAKFGSTINVVEKEFTGFTYDSKDKETIVIDTENNTATVYYTRNSYNYTIKHVELGNETNVLEIETGSANYQDEIAVKEKEFTGFTYDSKNKETIVIDTDKEITDDGIVIDTENNTATVYYTRNLYNYSVEYYFENLDGDFDLQETEIIKGVPFKSEIEYVVKEYDNYVYDETKTEAPELVLEDNMVVRLYYLLGDSNVEVHYVIKVEDNYIPFEKYGRDEFGNPTEDFADVELDDVTLTGKIGTEFTTKYREVKDYTFIGLYEGNIINNSEIAKLEGTTITDKFDFETKEYTYVYEAPKGGDELPPQTGFDGNISYINYILLIAVVYILKKYFELISTK